MSYYGLNDRIRFGKHRGETIKHIIDHDPDYFNWMQSNLDDVEFSAKAVEYAADGSFGDMYEADEDDEDCDGEYERLLRFCRREGISSPKELTDYITENDLSEEFPNLTGDVEFSSGGTLSNGIAPSVYGDLCRDLGFGGKSDNDNRVTGYTPNRDLY